MNQSLAGLKGNDEKSARDLQTTREALEALRKTMDEGLTVLQNQVRGLNNQINELKTKDENLPSAAQLFGQAYSEYNSGFWDLSIATFTEFLKNYPKNERSAAAAVYIGESYLAQKKLDQAAAQFDLVLREYGDSDRKCIALYRKGQILVEQKQIPEAKTALETVTRDCPGTPEASNAATQLKTLPKVK